jgi:hypothetical protein
MNRNITQYNANVPRYQTRRNEGAVVSGGLVTSPGNRSDRMEWLDKPELVRECLCVRKFLDKPNHLRAEIREI